MANTKANAKAANLTTPACLIIMDGLGLAEPSDTNAVSVAKTPCLDMLFETCPWVRLQASGNAVGLPAGQMGNSEVGHLNIGAGRVVNQELTRINNACETGEIAKNAVLISAFEAAKKPDAALHLMGLLSDGGVHSSNQHLYALITAAVHAGVEHVYIHAFMDGRDVSPTSGLGYVKQLEQFIADGGLESKVQIASISGRYYAMDRDARWNRVQKAYDAIVSGLPVSGEMTTHDIFDVSSPCEAVQASYDAGITDEFIEPTCLVPPRGVNEGDSVVFFNFRPDRARQLTRAFVDENFSGFKRERHPAVNFVCLTEYDPEIKAAVAFPKTFPENVLADVLASAGLRQYHIAETEKYAHVTFFFNGGREQPKAGEVRKLIASPKVATYDLQPEMSCAEVANALSSAIDANEADVYIVNFANPDMVGHTGNMQAAVAAVEAVDMGVSQVLAAIERAGGVAFVTADHGNCEKMAQADGSPHTAHTTAPVPFIFVDYARTQRTLKPNANGALCDIAPTILDVIGIAKPAEMTGKSLLD